MYPTYPEVGKSQPETMDYNQNWRQTLKTWWNRWTEHKISMVLAPVFFLLSSVSFAALIIGGEKRWNCPANPKIPIWLIVFGVLGVIWCWLMTFLIVGRAICDDPYRKRFKVLLIITTLMFLAFFVAWDITALKWMSKTHNDEKMNCDSKVYNFTYGLSIAQLVIIGLSLGCLCG